MNSSRKQDHSMTKRESIRNKFDYIRKTFGLSPTAITVNLEKGTHSIIWSDPKGEAAYKTTITMDSNGENNIDSMIRCLNGFIKDMTEGTI